MTCTQTILGKTMNSIKVEVKVEEQQDHTVREERHGLIASLTGLVRYHDIVSATSMSNNRIVVSFETIGDWILYANTGTCFKPCDGVVGYMLSGLLRHEMIFHTARLA